MRGALSSKRLKLLASFYNESPYIWDIGCDHGLLGLSFYELPQCREIHLVDPSLKVIETLQKSLADAYITIPEKIKIHHQFGQDIQTNLTPKCIFIAGMGGKEIQEICTHLISQMHKNDRLVISPHRKILELREFLYNSELRLIDETLAFEGGQYYQILCLSRDPKYSKVSLYGDKLWSEAIGKNYRDQQLSTFINHQDTRSKCYVDHLRSLYP